VLADIQGAGIVRRIWITVNERSPEMLRSLRLEMFWDGATTPAVSAPLGDFFGAGLGALVPFENAFFSSPEGRSFNTWIPMPFRRSARILLTNDASKDVNLVFYDVDYTLGDPPQDAMYFHAYWHRDRATTVGQDFRVLPRISGRGRYIGATLGVVTAPAYGGLVDTGGQQVPRTQRSVSTVFPSRSSSSAMTPSVSDAGLVLPKP